MILFLVSTNEPLPNLDNMGDRTYYVAANTMEEAARHTQRQLSARYRITQIQDLGVVQIVH